MEQTDGEILLEMNHVKKSFDGNGVLEDISLTVKRGSAPPSTKMRWSPSSVPPVPGSPHCFAVQRFWKKWTAVS